MTDMKANDLNPAASNGASSSALPERRRRRRLLLYGVPLLLLLFAANHLEYHFRQQRLKSHDAAGMAIRLESNPLSGHMTIGIEEGSSNEGDSLLHFASLGQWEYDPKAPSECPKQIQALSGRNTSCLGFMYPLESGAELKTFCLMRSTQTCCYGPRPQYNQYLLVEMKSPVKFERLTPVVVHGRFIVDPQPSQGYIYRMEGVGVTPVEDDEPDGNPADEATKAGLPLFDFAQLETAWKDKEIPAALKALDGKSVMVAGYFFERADKPIPQLLVGCKYWDGVSKGIPPGIFNAVLAYPMDSNQMPPVWKDKGIMKGVVHVEPDSKAWSRKGIVSLENAVRMRKGKPLRLDSGPRLETWQEALLLGVLLLFALRRGEARKNENGVEK